MALEIALGFHSKRLDLGEFSSWMVEVIQLVMLVLFLRARHRAIPLGRLEPWEAATKSLLTSFVFGCLLFIASMACVNYFDRDWLFRLVSWQVEKRRAAGVPETELRTYITATYAAYAPLGLARSCLVVVPLLGAGFGVVFAILLNLRWEKAHLAKP